MVILWRGVEVTVMVVVLVLLVLVVGVVLLRGGVVVVVVVLLALDVGVGEEERRGGGGGRGGGLLGRGHAHCQGPVALDGAVPAGGAGLRGRRQEAGPHRDRGGDGEEV